jgi:hypothetical protein
MKVVNVPMEAASVLMEATSVQICRGCLFNNEAASAQIEAVKVAASAQP